MFEEPGWGSILSVVLVVGAFVELHLATSSSILGTNSGMRNGFETMSSWGCQHWYKEIERKG